MSPQNKILFALVITILSIQLSEQITISTSCSAPAPRCYTLFGITLPPASNLTLDLLPGTHNLVSLSIQDRAHLSLVGQTGATVINCTTQRSSNLRITRLARVTIRNIIFVGCNLQFSQSNNTKIKGSRFLNGTNGALEFSSSFNVSIDKSLFNNNGNSLFGGVIEFSNSRGIEVSQSNFTNNNIFSSFAGLINMDTSIGFISCSHFHNNSAGSLGGIIKTDRTSFLYVTNSSFTENRLGSFGGVILLKGSGDHVIVISCVFKFNTAGSFSGVISLDKTGEIQVLASEFLHNIAIGGVFGGTICRSSAGVVTIDCTRFLNTTANSGSSGSDIIMTIRNSTSESCQRRFAIGESGVCLASTCEGMMDVHKYLRLIIIIIYLLHFMDTLTIQIELPKYLASTLPLYQE